MLTGVSRLRSKALYKLYLGRTLPLIAVFCIMILLCGNEVVYHSGIVGVLIVPLLALSGCVMFYMMRSKNDHGYINAFPITKKQQWKAMYLAVMTMIAIVFVVYFIITFIQCHKGNGVGEMLITVIVEVTATVFVTTLLLWILGHTDFKFTKVLVAMVLGLVGLIAVGAMIQKAFNTGANNFAFELKNYWVLLTVPVDVFNKAITPVNGISIYKTVSFSDKITVLIIYMAITLVLSAVLGFLACKNYGEFKLEKDIKAGYAKKFNPILKAVFIVVISMSVLCGVEEIIGKFAVEKVDLTLVYNDVEDFDKIPVEYWEYSDSIFIKEVMDDKIVYEGIEHNNLEISSLLVTYEVYKGEFSDLYKYIFGVNGLLSVVAAVYFCRSKRKEGAV